VSLSETDRQKLTARGFSIDALEKRRIARISNTNRRHEQIVQCAKNSLADLTKEQFLLAGSALYWGDGRKTLRGGARIPNSDPDAIRIMMRFFREILAVPEGKFRT